MLFIKLWRYAVLIVWVLKPGTSNALSSEYQNSTCRVELNKKTLPRGSGEINLTIDTKLKADFADFQKIILAEFSQQNERLKQQQQELRASMERLIKNEVQTMKVQLSRELEAIFSEKLQSKTSQLLEGISKNFSSELKLQEESFENIVKAIVPPRPADLRKWDENFNCTENCGPIMDLPNGCEAAMSTASSKDGIYLLNLEDGPLKPFYAYCQRFDNKVWTIIQRREDGSVDFYRDWTDYKHGFGNLYGEFWLGLERLNALTVRHRHELHIWMKNKNGKTAYAQYAQFAIGNETEKYKLTLSDYSGNAGDELILSGTAAHNGMKFSTYDNCNDIHKEGNEECAKTYRGAWWFSKCYNSHLNGPYKTSTKNGVDWDKFDKQLKYVRMAIRKV